MFRLSVLTAVALVVASVQVPGSECRMVGGFGDESAASEEEIGLLKSNIELINAGHSSQDMKLTKAVLESGTLTITVRRQVVAGINFWFTIRGIVENKALRIKIYRPLGANPVIQITEIEIVQSTS